MTRLEEMEAGCIEKQQIQFVKCGNKSLFKGLIKKKLCYFQDCVFQIGMESIKFIVTYNLKT